MSNQSLYEIVKLKRTVKLYYADQYLTNCIATVLEVAPYKGVHSAVRVGATVAFAEGGGQPGDRGWLCPMDGSLEPIPFADTKKGLGRPLFIPDFPSIAVDVPVWHLLEKADDSNTLKVGDKVRIKIDVTRRALLTIGHTASHLAFMGVRRIRPDAEIIGFSLSENSARFDFRTERFQPEEIEMIEQIANDLVRENREIKQFPHPDEPEAWYWQCGPEPEATMPCGGTHLRRTGQAGPIHVKRKSIGKGKDRLMLTFNQNPDLSIYHEE